MYKMHALHSTASCIKQYSNAFFSVFVITTILLWHICRWWHCRNNNPVYFYKDLHLSLTFIFSGSLPPSPCVVCQSRTQATQPLIQRVIVNFWLLESYCVCWWQASNYVWKEGESAIISFRRTKIMHEKAVFS